MIDQQVDILLIEDNPDEAELAIRSLKKATLPITLFILMMAQKRSISFLQKENTPETPHNPAPGLSYWT